MKKKFNQYDTFIVTDEKNVPMAWDSGSKQLCYCDDERWSEYSFPLKTYSLRQARLHIRNSIKNRKKWGMKSSPYYLMPVAN